MHKSEMKFMKGTEGNKDYLVIAVKEGLALGIKPIFEPQGIKTDQGFQGTGNWHVGIRIRAASYEAVVLNVGFAAKKVFPSVVFHPETIDAIRASCFMGTIAPPIKKATDVDIILGTLVKGGYFAALAHKITEQFAEVALLYTIESIIEFIHSSFRSVLLSYEGLCVDNSIVALPIPSGKVLQFYSKVGNA